MSLEGIIKEIARLQPIAADPLEDNHTNTLIARRGRKARAIEELKLLNEKYVAELLRSTVFILTVGAAKDQFTQIATEQFNTFAADPEDFYKDLVNRVHPTLYEGKEAVSNLFDVLGRHLEDKANELGVVSYPQLIFKASYQRSMKTKEDFLAIVKTAMNEQVGGELAGIDAIRKIAKQAIEKGHSKKITSLILNTNDSDLALDLIPALQKLTPYVFLVVAGKASKAFKRPGAIAVKEATPETVEAALTNIKETLRRP